jgi:hypothetical protein
MNYKVPLKKLVKILNPFEQRLVNDSVIDKMTVKSYLKSQDIFGDFPWAKEKHVAALVANYYPEEIVLNIPEQISDPKEILVSGLYDLAAAIYRNEEYIVANLSGDEKIIKKLLGITLTKPDNIDLPKKPEVIPFKWDINFNLKKESWGDIDFVIKKLKEDCSENIRFIDDALWHDSQFLKTVMRKRKDFKNFNWPKEVKASEVLFEIVKASPYSFKDWWLETYRDWFDNQLEKTKNNQAQENIVQRIKNELFSDVDYVSKLFEAEYSWQSRKSSYQKYISREIFFDEKIIDLVVKKKEEEEGKKDSYSKIFTYIDHLGCVPENLAQDNEWMRKFLAKYLRFHESHSESIPKNLYANWINDKDEVLKNLEIIDTPIFARMYKHLPPDLKKDNEIAEAFLKKFPFLLSSMPGEYQQDEKRISAYLNTCENRINKEILAIIYQKKNKELMEEALYVNADLLFKTECPDELMFDIDLIKIVAQKDKLSFLNKKQESIIFGKKEYAIEIIQYSQYYYSKLASDLKTDHEIALKNVQYHKNCDAQLLADKNFAMQAFRANQKITENIPKQYWYEKDFVLAVCQAIDDNLCDDEIFTMAPVEVKTFFDSYKVESNFVSFINKYLTQQKLSNDLLSEMDDDEEEDVSPKMKI